MLILATRSESAFHLRHHRGAIIAPVAGAGGAEAIHLEARTLRIRFLRARHGSKFAFFSVS